MSNRVKYPVNWDPRSHVEDNSAFYQPPREPSSRGSEIQRFDSPSGHVARSEPTLSPPPRPMTPDDYQRDGGDPTSRRAIPRNQPSQPSCFRRILCRCFARSSTIPISTRDGTDIHRTRRNGNLRPLLKADEDLDAVIKFGLHYMDNKDRRVKLSATRTTWLSPLTRLTLVRIAFIIVAVGLLWATTLSLCRQFVQQTIPTLNYEQTRDGVRLALQDVDVLNIEYGRCARKQTDACRTFIYSEFQAERARLNLSIELSNSITQTIIQKRETCSAQRDGLRILFAYIVGPSMSINLANATYCRSTQARCTELLGLAAKRAALVKADAAAVQAVQARQSREAQAIAEEVARNISFTNQVSGTAASNLTQQALAYYATLVAALSRPNTTVLFACMNESAMQPNAQCPGLSVSAQMQQRLADVQDKYEQAKNDTRDLWSAYKSSLPMNLINLIARANSPPSTFLANFDASSVAFPEPPVGPTFPTGALIPMTSLNNAITVQQQQFNQNLAILLANYSEQRNSSTLNDTIAWVAALMSAGYNPPSLTYPPSGGGAAQVQLDLRFLAGIRETLGTGARSDTTDELNAARNIQNDVAFARASSEQSGLLGTVTSDDMRFGDVVSTLLTKDPVSFIANLGFDASLLTRALELGQTLADMVDLLYRIVHTIFIVFLYLSLSTVETTPVDVRTQDNAAIARKIDPMVSPLKGWGIVFLALIILGGMFIALVSNVWSVYTPFFVDFTGGCLDPFVLSLPSLTPSNAFNQTSLTGWPSNVTIPQTLIAGNAFPLAFQASTARGEAIFADFAARISSERNSLCYNESETAYQIFRAYSDVYKSNSQMLADSVADLADLNAVFNIPRIDQIPGLSPALISLVTGGLIADLNLDPECSDVNIDAFQSDAFDCSRIRSCSIRCPLPPQPRVVRDVYVASCLSQTYAHGSFIGTFLSALVFISLNLSRIIFLIGLRVLIFDYLSPNYYSYMETRMHRALKKVDPAYALVVDDDDYESLMLRGGGGGGGDGSSSALPKGGPIANKSDEVDRMTSLLTRDEIHQSKLMEACVDNINKHRRRPPFLPRFPDAQHHYTIRNVLAKQFDQTKDIYRAYGYVVIFLAILINVFWVYVYISSVASFTQLRSSYEAFYA